MTAVKKAEEFAEHHQGRKGWAVVKYQVKIGMFGKLRVLYECPACEAKLYSALNEAGKSDKCPECDTHFAVPGSAALVRQRVKIAEQEQLRIERIKAEQVVKTKALEQKRLAHEEKMRRQQERTTREEEARLKRYLRKSMRRDEEFRRAKEAAELHDRAEPPREAPPAVALGENPNLVARGTTTAVDEKILKVVQVIFVGCFFSYFVLVCSRDHSSYSNSSSTPARSSSPSRSGDNYPEGWIHNENDQARLRFYNDTKKAKTWDDVDNLERKARRGDYD